MASSPQTAWEPITPRGVSAFARATIGRLWLVQFIFAFLAAAVVMWCLYQGYCPIIREAIEQMPPEGAIRSGRLEWGGESPRLLAEGRFLAFSVDADRASDLRSPAHVQVEFRKDGVLFHSIFGYSEARYPSGWVIAFNRTELEPWWGAWQPWLLTFVGAGVVAYLMLSWTVLATLYMVPVWVMAFYANRDLKWGASWKLSGATLMPGALLLVVALLLYALTALDLIHLMIVFGAHLLVGWIYLGVSPWFLPLEPQAATEKQNPFAPSPVE